MSVIIDASFVSVSRSALASAIELVPFEKRGEFALKLLGLDAPFVEPAVEEDFHRSHPITTEVAHQLMQKIDPATKEVLKIALMNVKDGVAVVNWDDIKRTTGVTHWSQFAKGKLGGLHRSLSGLTQPRAKLLIEADGWVEDGKGDYLAGSMFIDGPAVQSLQAVLGEK